MRHKKLLTILLFSLLSLVLASCSQPSSTANNMAAFVDTYNESCQSFNGAIMVVKGDDILLEKGYGMANYET